MKKIFTLFAALAMVMSMSAVPYLKGSFNGWGEGNSLSSGSTTVTLNANATYEFKVNDGSNWYGNNGTMTSTNCTDWTMSSGGGNCKITTTIAGVYTFKWNASSKKLSVVYPTEAVEINYYITGTGNLVGGDGWKANEIKMTNNNGTYTHTFTALAAGNYEMKITQGNWDNTLGFSNLATSYVGVTGNNDNNIVMALADATNLTVTVTGTTVSLSLPEKTNTIYFVNEKGWAKVNAYVWTDNPYKPWPGEAMTKVEGKTYGGKDVYTYTYPANNSKVIFNDGGSNQTDDLTYSEATPYYYNGKWNASIAYDKAKYTVNVTAENGTVTGAGEYEEGKEATLTATPAEGYEFTCWTSGEDTVSTANPYKFTVTANVALVANFKLIPPTKYNVNVTAENGTVTGAGEYEAGAEATLTANAAEGYEFTCWTSGEDTVSTVNPYKFTVTANVDLVANFKEAEPEIEWMPMELEITNLVTEVIESEGAKYLQLMGSNDMMDAEVTLFLNDYADVDDDYVVNAENSYMTYGGLELTVLEGTMTQTSETDKGTLYTGTVRATVTDEEEGGTMYLEFALTMYAVPATPLVITDATVELNEELGTLTFKTTLDDGDYMVELSDYTAPGVHEGPQICLLETPEVVAFATYVVTTVADGVITLKGEFTSAMGPKFDLTISGTLPVEKIAYELNGGELPTVTVPTQDSLIAAFKDGYNAYFGVSVATTRAIDNFLYAGAAVNDPTCDVSLFMKDDASPWKWLGDYVLAVTNAQIEAGLLVNLKELATELMWRQSLTGFFLQQAQSDSNYKGNANFTEAGKPEAWGAAYQAAHAVVLPTEPVDAPYTLPTPVKEGYKFVGWYDNAEGTGEAYTVIPADWSGTLYAIWEAEGPATALDNIAIEGKVVKTIINGQLIIIKNGVQYNAQGAVIK